MVTDNAAAALHGAAPASSGEAVAKPSSPGEVAVEAAYKEGQGEVQGGAQGEVQGTAPVEAVAANGHMEFDERSVGLSIADVAADVDSSKAPAEGEAAAAPAAVQEETAQK